MGKRTNTAAWIPSLKRWQIKVQKDGKRRAFTSSTPGRKGQRECNAKADAWLDDGLVEQNRKIEDLYKEWLVYLQTSTSLSHWRPVESRWRTHVIPAMGNKRVDRVTEGQWQDFIASVYAEGKAKKTLQNYCSDIRAFYKWMRAHNYTTMQLEFLSAPKGARVGERTILQPDGMKVLFTSDASTWYRKPCRDPLVRAYRFQVASGLRPGELVGLCWDDINGFCGARTDWQAAVGSLVCIKRAVNIYEETTTGKNQNARRSFVLFPLLADILQEQFAYTGRDLHVFPIEDEKSYYRSWVRYCRANGIPEMSLYELRHTFVSIAKLLPAGEVKSWVGHSKDMDTFGVYSHALSTDGQRAAQDFSRLYDDLFAL